MKKLSVVLLAVAALFVSTDLFAQGKWGADSAECIKYMSYYKEYYKQKSYDEATPNWRQAYKLCPATASQNMLIEGTTLVKRLISKNYKNPVYKEALIDTLLTLYDLRAENYPKYTVTALNNKGIDMNNYIKDNPQKLYDGYKGIIENNKAETNPAIFMFALNAAVDLYQNGTLAPDDIINAYQQYNEYIEQITPKNDAEAEKIASVKSTLNTLFAGSKVASCENLIDIYTPRFAEDPENLQLATNIVKTMSMAEDCMTNDLYLKAVTVMYNKEPSATSAYFLYQLNKASDNVSEACKYIEEAIARDDSDAKQDAEWTYEYATFCFKNGMNSKAYELALRAAKDETFAGKSYFLAGTIWGSVRCGGDEITSRAPYWVACDFFAKAKAADPSLTDEANRYIGKFSSYFPEAADAFMYNLQKGQAFTANCGGMTASTTVKTR